MGHQEDWMLLADNVGRLLLILQGVPRLSEVWKYSQSPSISSKPYYQAMTNQRMGNRLDWPNKSSI
jgi:hypothetical protein